jgi:methylmalonyl-CoA mutase
MGSIQKVKASRDNNKVKAALAAIEASARSGNGNLLTLSVDAARVRATLGEISDALEKVCKGPSPKSHTFTAKSLYFMGCFQVFGRYEPVNRVVSGAYKSEYAKQDHIKYDYLVFVCICCCHSRC